MKALLLACAALALAPLACATEINVAFSEDFTEELADNYGTREGAYLSDRIRQSLTRAMDKAGLDPARIDVVIEDAKPNKPTFKQLGDEPGLSYGDSVSIGGLDVQARVFDASGAEISSLDYDWYETDISNAGLTTWSDARRASDRFARKLARHLAK